MPLVTARPVSMNNGDLVTEFVDTVGTNGTTWTYSTTQNRIQVKNEGDANVTVNVGDISQVIQKGKVWSTNIDFTSVTINSASKTQQISVLTTVVSVFNAGNITAVLGAFTKSKNLFDVSKVTAGYDLNNNGTTLADARFHLSDFIPISPSTYYVLNKVVTLVFYNSSKAAIGNRIADMAAGTAQLSPANARYLRFSYKIANVDGSTIQLEQNQYVTSFVTYNQKQLIKDYLPPIELNRSEIAGIVLGLNKGLTTKKTFLLSESIFQSGNFVTAYTSQFSPAVGTTQNIFGGSHCSTALAEMADVIYVSEGNAWVKKTRNYTNYTANDLAIISFGRNELNDTTVLPESHYRAYDKLIECLTKFYSLVIPTNPPPKNNSGVFDFANDLYNTRGGNDYFNSLCLKWNQGFNVWEYFKQLSDTGGYTAASLMADNWHQNAAGGLLMANKIAEEVKNKKLMNGAKAQLGNPVKLYVGGIATGTWTDVALTSWIFDRLYTGGLNVAKKSSTVNDTLSFENVTCEQVHILFLQGSSYGTVDVIVDEGTSKEKTKTVSTQLSSGDRVIGNHVFDFLDNTAHTIKIKVKTGTVNIIGIVAI